MDEPDPYNPGCTCLVLLVSAFVSFVAIALLAAWIWHNWPR